MSPSVPRLKRRAQFLRVARAGRRWAAPGLVLQAWDRGGSDPTADAKMIRVGFTVSRKVGNAVARNRARRRLKAVAAAVFPEQGLPGHDYVVIGRAATLDREHAALIDDLNRAIRKTAGRFGKEPVRRGRRQRNRHRQVGRRSAGSA